MYMYLLLTGKFNPCSSSSSILVPLIVGHSRPQFISIDDDNSGEVSECI